MHIFLCKYFLSNSVKGLYQKRWQIAIAIAKQEEAIAKALAIALAIAIAK
jgi:hypothetical protein